MWCRLRLKRMRLYVYIASICLINSAFARDYDENTKSTVPNQFKTVNASIQTELTAHTLGLLNQHRALVQTNAVIAIKKTQEALVLIENGNNALAKQFLGKALNNLQQLKDQHPELDTVPIRVSKLITDDLKSLDDINSKKEQINSQLDQKDLQSLRRLLNYFGSEVVISTEKISVDGFVQRLQEVKQLMTQGNSNDARLVIEQLLQSIKQVDYTVPLPIFRAELLIKEAEQLVQENKEKKQYTKAQMKWFLNQAEYQLKIGEALGYGNEERYLFLYQAVEGLHNLVDAG